MRVLLAPPSDGPLVVNLAPFSHHIFVPSNQPRQVFQKFFPLRANRQNLTLDHKSVDING